MDIFSEIRTFIGQALLTAQIVEKSHIQNIIDKISVEPPRDAHHGDIATNIAMILAKVINKTPIEIAEELAEHLKKSSHIKAITIAKPGFINISLSEAVLYDILSLILTKTTDFGRTDIGAHQRVNIEYVSANPTGPLHIGHVRGAVLGDSLARLMEYVGFSVTREYYVNDAGAQVDGLARSLYVRYLEVLGYEIDGMETSYPGDYLKDIAQQLCDQKGTFYLDQPEEVWLTDIRVFAIEKIMDIIRQDLESLGIEMDVYSSEKALIDNGKIHQTFEQLKQKELIYKGILEPPKGKIVEDWEMREQMLFKSTSYGDDRDRPLKKADGSWTYFAPDIAYHNDKIDRGFDILIDILGADHSGYIKRMKAAVSALSSNRVPLDIKTVQIVRFLKNGEPFKMSKRAGKFILLRDVVDEVGADVTRFVMLTRRNDAQLDFDFDEVLRQSQDNPVFYVQYAHARIKSALNKAKKAGIDISLSALMDADLTSLNDKYELSLLRKLAEWPRLVKNAARTHEPQRVASYLYELASELHSHWTRGNSQPKLRFIQPDDSKASQAKIALIYAVSVVISNGLSILGVKPVDEMR